MYTQVLFEFSLAKGTCSCGCVLLKYNVSVASVISQVIPASLHHIQQQYEVCVVYL